MARRRIMHQSGGQNEEIWFCIMDNDVWLVHVGSMYTIASGGPHNCCAHQTVPVGRRHIGAHLDVLISRPCQRTALDHNS